MEIIELDIRDIEQLRVFWEVEQAAHRYDRARPLLRTFDSVASTYADPTPTTGGSRWPRSSTTASWGSPISASQSGTTSTSPT